MLNRRFVTTLIVLLVTAYLGALVVSTAHLSQLYGLFNTGLPYWVSIGLAVALEAVAFIFSIISTSLGKEAGPWPAWASTSALVLIWAGNGYAMKIAAPDQPWFVTLGASCFVPVCTLMVGKALGGLFGLLDRLGKQERDNVKSEREAEELAADRREAQEIAALEWARAEQVRQELFRQELAAQTLSADATTAVSSQTVDSSLNIQETIDDERPPVADHESPTVPHTANGRILVATNIVSPVATSKSPTTLAESPPPPPGRLETQLQTLGHSAELLQAMVMIWLEHRDNQQKGGKKSKVAVSGRDEVALAVLGANGHKYAALGQQLGIPERRARAVASEVRTLMEARGYWAKVTR